MPAREDATHVSTSDRRKLWQRRLQAFIRGEDRATGAAGADAATSPRAAG